MVKRLGKQQKQGGMGVLLGLAIVGVIGANMLSVSSQSTAADSPPPAQPASDYYKPAPNTPDIAADTDATIVVPKGSSASVNNLPAQKLSSAKAASQAGANISAVTLPATPGHPTPETITINLKTPLYYILKPGQKSPVLQHQMVDGARYAWRPSTATTWQGQPHDPSLPVWATITMAQPDAPYISDHLSFTVEAAKDAKPGNYNTEILFVLRDTITAGIPLVVTVE